ncbi:hypothetical protein [Pedomonas mirosovicensis]|uniref:hypothetical protein n=1 Tax=Pedomonas mirosovicensis TaxID=2908641 RepID=UPI002169444B|nr:hypothetical protein [Pedomonas mirosovicensis]MCH8686040.1 hypothetical protein [Pedomonas mirosovicensis]
MSPKVSNSPKLNDRTTDAPRRPDDAWWSKVPDDQNGDSLYVSPEEKLEEEENNPWHNRENDQSKWLGLLLAAVGLGAIGYLISGV